MRVPGVATAAVTVLLFSLTGASATERWLTLPEPPPMPEASQSG